MRQTGPALEISCGSLISTATIALGVTTVPLLDRRSRPQTYALLRLRDTSFASSLAPTGVAWVQPQSGALPATTTLVDARLVPLIFRVWWWCRRSRPFDLVFLLHCGSPSRLSYEPSAPGFRLGRACLCSPDRQTKSKSSPSSLVVHSEGSDAATFSSSRAQPSSSAISGRTSTKSSGSFVGTTVSQARTTEVSARSSVEKESTISHLPQEPERQRSGVTRTTPSARSAAASKFSPGRHVTDFFNVDARALSSRVSPEYPERER